MAFLPQAEDQSQTGAQQSGTQSQVPVVPTIPSLQGSSGPNVSQGSGTQAPTTNTASPGASPTAPWQNITTYLTANQPQASQVAGTIANNLSSTYNNLASQIPAEQTSFGNSINAGTVNENTDLINSAASDPTTFVQDPNNVSSFQNELNAQYTGPQSFSGSADYSNLQNAILQGQTNAALANQGTPGYQTLLQGVEGPQASAGETALDSLLMQETPDFASQIQGAAAPYSNLTGMLNTTQAALDAQAQAGAQTTAQTAQNVQNQFSGPGGVMPTFQDQLNSTLQANQGKATAFNSEIADIISKLNSGQSLTPQEQFDADQGGGLSAVDPYGQSGGAYQNALAEGLPGVGPNFLAQYFTPTNQVGPATAQNSTTPDQIAEENALNQLMGQTEFNVPTPTTPFSVPANPGTYDDQGMLQGLLGTLNNDTSYLGQMSPDQYTSWLGDVDSINGLLGNPSTMDPNPTPLQPVSNPTPSGPPYLAPPGSPGGTTTSPGGGRHTF